VTFIFPKMDKVRTAGIYKIVFENGNKYVGSSSNLRNRFYIWKTAITTGKGLQSNVISSVRSSNIIIFEIIELVFDESILKGREALHYFKVMDEAFLVGARLINKYIPTGTHFPSQEYFEYEKQKIKDFPHVWRGSFLTK
jgi:hypothetical protein